jgi:hypothetical protein
MDNIWVEDINILFKKDRVLEFFPTKEQSNYERLNSVVRLAMYSSIILSLYYSNKKYMFILVFVLFFTFMIYKHRPNPIEKTIGTIRDQIQDKAREEYYKSDNIQKLNDFIPSDGIEQLESNPLNTNNLDYSKDYKGECTKPTIDNPFMNFTMADYMNVDSNGKIFDRPPACDSLDPEIKKEIDVGFNNNLFKDVNDIFGKMNSQRNYYSAPSTEIVNDRENFMKWLYLAPKTCKEDTEYCTNGNFEDLRSNSFKQYEENPVNTEAKAKVASEQKRS